MENPQRDNERAATDGGTVSYGGVVRQDIHTVLKANGKDMDWVLKKCIELCEAEKVKYDIDGEESGREPDRNINHKGLTLLATMLGYMKTSDVNVGVVQVSAEKKAVAEMFREYRESATNE